MSAYNYDTFPLDFDMQAFIDFPNIANAGTKAPDGKVYNLLTKKLEQLSTYWKEKTTIIEFGSVTWSECALAAPGFDKLVEEFGDKFNFVFIYTREAHPGEKIPHLTSFEQKLGHAKLMTEKYINRTMLVDSLDGDMHHAYGRLPNMTYIVNRYGNVIYKSDWTDPSTIKMVLDHYLDEREMIAKKIRATPYYVEWQPMRKNDTEEFMTILLNDAGPKAIKDFISSANHYNGPIQSNSSLGKSMGKKLQDWLEKQDY